MKIPATFKALKALINGKSFIETRQILKDRRLAKTLVRKFGSSINEQADAMDAFRGLHLAKLDHAERMAQRPAMMRHAFIAPVHTEVGPPRPKAKAPRQPSQAPADAEVGGYVPMPKRKVSFDL